MLIITQKVDKDDDVLGFMHGWINEFAKNCPQVTVICLEKGRCDLPSNTTVLSLGKEEGISRIKYLRRFYKYIWQQRRNYDKVFVHMNAEYIILGWPIWNLLGKKIGLWYAHGYAPFALKIAEKLADVIFTSTKSGCRIKSDKIRVVGQGIDVDKFKVNGQNQKFKIISVGRISPSKDYETLINAAEILIAGGAEIKIEIAGAPAVATDDNYFKKLKNIIEEKQLQNGIKIIGSVPNKDIPSFLQSADLFVNMSHTGSLDKAILEAMACEIPVLTCNEALFEVFPDKYKDLLMYPKGNPGELAKKIKNFLAMGEEKRRKIGKTLREIVVENHNLSSLILKILKIFKDIQI